MALKRFVTKEELEAMAEPLRPLYVEQPDGKFALDAEGYEDVTGLKNALDAERTENKKIKAKLQETIDKFKDIDPVKAREAQAELQKMADKELIDKGKFEELFEQRTSRMKTDHETQLRLVSDQIANEKKRGDAAEARLSELLIDGALREAALKPEIGLKPAALYDVVLRSKSVWRLSPEGKPVPMNSDGTIVYGKDPSKGPMSMEEWVSSLREGAPYLFGESAGSGANTTGKDGKPKIGAGKRSEMNPVQKSEFINKYGSEEYMKLPA